MVASAKSTLSREAIAHAALAITDAGGLGELSMRKLGHHLGIEAMSLYHYVANKDDLLDAVLDELYGEIELPVDVVDQEWETAIRGAMGSFHGVLVRHQAALQLFAGHPSRSVRASEVQLWAYGRFLAVGLNEVQAHHAVHFAVSFVMGHATSELGTRALLLSEAPASPGQPPNPLMAGLVEQTTCVTADMRFQAGVDAVIAGLRALYQLP